MVKIAPSKQFNNKRERIAYINERLSRFTQSQKRNSGLTNLFNKRNDELDYIIQKLYRQRIKAVTNSEGKEVIVNTQEANSMYKDTPQYQAKVKKSAKNYFKKNKTLGTVNSIIIHLTHYGFEVAEAVWLVNKFGIRMSRWSYMMPSDEKEEFFNEVDHNDSSIERYLE